MSVGAVALAFVAGVLTTLSPCVLPILPLVLGAAASERKYGPVALAAGLAISFFPSSGPFALTWMNAPIAQTKKFSSSGT